jgi:UDP-glucose 4-epimerase
MADTVLVTGGAGFLGSHVAAELVAAGRRVVVLDDLSGGFRRNVPAGAELVTASIADAATVDALFRHHRFRHVYHLAALAAEGLSHFIRRRTYEVNLLGSVNLINAAVNHDVEVFVFTSSIAVHGEGGHPFREGDAPAPVDPYGASKLAVEHDLAAATALFGLRRVIFRPHNVYGEGQNLSDPYRNVVGIFMAQALAGQPCTIFGDGSQTRGFTHVSDVAPAIARCVEVPEARDQVFNVGADRTATVLELAGLVQRALGREVGVRHLPSRVEAHDAVSDHGRARRVFGLGEPLGLEEGIARMARWAKTVTPRPPRVIDGVEIARNLPPSWAALTRPSG